MNTKEIIDAVSSKLALTKSMAKDAVDFVLNLFVKSALLDGSSRFGKFAFKRKDYEERKFKVPTTTEETVVPAHSVVVFKQKFDKVN